MPPIRETALQRWTFLATAALLALVFVTGGGSYDRGWGDAIAELAALPVLVMAMVLVSSAPRGRVLVLCLVLLLPVGIACQLLPTPAAMNMDTGRAALLADMAVAGVGNAPLQVSLTPWATERGLWSVLPALAAFVAALALPIWRQRQMAWLLVGLITFSLVLGYLQLGAPQDSPLNPFPEWAPALNGVFANPNHQATAITVALVIVLSWLLDGGGDPYRHSGTVPNSWLRGGAVLLALFLLVALPLTGSRAMVLIAAAALLALPVLNGWLQGQFRRRGRRKLGLAMLIAGAVAAGMLLVAITSWIKVDSELESRGALATSTGQMAAEAMPLGTGLGSFVPWFDTHAPDPLMQYAYFNYAHNEYAQWWLESGVPGVLWIGLLLGTMTWAFPYLALRRRSARVPARPSPKQAHDAWLTGAAWLGVAVVLAHSLVDYPLRTPALLTATACLAGLMVAGAFSAAPRT